MRSEEPVWRTLILPNGEERIAAVLPGGPWWLVEAIWPGETGWRTGEIEADVAAPWTDGVLFLFNEGDKARERHLVRAFAPGAWRSCSRAPDTMK